MMAKQPKKPSKPKPKTGAKSAARPAAKTKRAERKADTRTPRDKAIDAALALAVKADWNAITLKRIAAKAGLALSELIAEFPSKLAILRGFMRRIDAKVMDAIDPALSDEPARERLLDVMIARFETLAPHKAALRSILAAIARDPDALMALNRSAVRSQLAMLAAAEIGAEGVSGIAKAQGLALINARVFRIWLADDDPGMARTMAELDRRLRGGERALERLSGLARFMRLGSDFASAVWSAARERRGKGVDPMQAN